jgi:hypothetical protein
MSLFSIQRNQTLQDPHLGRHFSLAESLQELGKNMKTKSAVLIDWIDLQLCMVVSAAFDQEVPIRLFRAGVQCGHPSIARLISGLGGSFPIRFVDDQPI